MEIAFYKDIQVREYIKLSKSGKNKVHVKTISFYVDNKFGCNQQFEKTYPAQDRSVKLFDERRYPNKKEILSFCECHKKEILKWLIEKYFKLEITDELEKELCDKWDVFNYDEEPNTYEYF